MENTLDFDKVSVRCPTCLRPYEVEAHLIQSHEPLFQCVSCETRFTFEWPQPFSGIELLTWPWTERQTVPTQSGVEELNIFENSASMVESKPAPSSPLDTLSSFMESCPLCGTENRSTDERCVKCGLDLEKYNDKQSKIEKSLRSEVFEAFDEEDLEGQWRNVLAHWQDEMRHQSFLSLCDKKKSLSFASGKYNRFLSENPTDDIAKKMKVSLKALAENELFLKTTGQKKNRGRESSLQKVLMLSALFLSALLILVGIFSPANRNLVGLGISCAILTAGIYFLLQNNPGPS